MKDGDAIVRRSVLDRLLQTGEPEPRTWHDSVRQTKAAVARDVEWLLNTRCISTPAPDTLTELRDSVYHYGLPDITSFSADSVTARRELLRNVTDTVQRFEPRLTNVRVREVAKASEGKREIRFVVEGMLRLHPQPEPVAFDTVLEATSGRFTLAGEAGG
jgi:type VI secretion system protein ImpF